MAETGSREINDAHLAEQVARIWRDVLGVPAGSTDVTFFDLGGQSIAAVRIAGRIEDELGIQVDVGLLFEDLDLAAFTRHVRAAAGLPDTAPTTG
ncbi:phosphopantetheine-binding protein [Solwaraspora sp. WMMA2056]|uniref:phosphopantetheine-binding protein n=1 Tax=Solwaraspora sp. WMMA2056 TaxID=3015161 RepID=UPI00259BEB6B|nr:phosphopantetheine-binding protein [Solwaraspora sp. WMMA2056]WJK42580.1 phosphopantetheine-binding protein [Solwaraspora sp. WMMA2056]